MMTLIHKFHKLQLWNTWFVNFVKALRELTPAGARKAAVCSPTWVEFHSEGLMFEGFLMFPMSNVTVKHFRRSTSLQLINTLFKIFCILLFNR